MQTAQKHRLCNMGFLRSVIFKNISPVHVACTSGRIFDAPALPDSLLKSASPPQPVSLHYKARLAETALTGIRRATSEPVRLQLLLRLHWAKIGKVNPPTDSSLLTELQRHAVPQHVDLRACSCNAWSSVLQVYVEPYMQYTHNTHNTHTRARTYEYTGTCTYTNTYTYAH